MEVLVVDDETLVREIVSDNLEDDGFRVASAGSAEDALRITELEGPPKVVVVDVNLGPGMNGLRLVEEIYQRSPSAGVVIMTGDPAAVNQWKWRDNERYLQKPFGPIELSKAVRDLMQR